MWVVAFALMWVHAIRIVMARCYGVDVAISHRVPTVLYHWGSCDTGEVVATCHAHTCCSMPLR
jgi:hypothetical protein